MTVTQTPASREAGREGKQRERIPVLIFDDPDDMSLDVAKKVASLIRDKQEAGEKAVLGLPTGSTPISVYRELVRMHREEGLDFSNVVTFNLDEYYPMEPAGFQSYHRFMEENFFSEVNIPEDQRHIPDGSIPSSDVEVHVEAYEQMIADAGGLDIVLLGIGRSGHIGFNEPGSGPGTRTRRVVLDEITRKDAASDFFGEEYVPREAITMGVGTILDAKEVILMATGEHKAPIVRRAVEEPPTRDISATFLQNHPQATFYLDRAAAGNLTREKTPWLVREVTWNDDLAKQAVLWLSEELDRPILHLEKADFHRHGLHSLAHGGVDALCLRVFEDLRGRIRLEHQLPKKKKVIVFSPHPDDDVISMGGTLAKLVRNECDVTVAYMTNGSIAVFDEDVERHLHFVDLSAEHLGISAEADGSMRQAIKERFAFLRSKSAGEVDPEAVQGLKAHIRYAEAIAAIRVLGLGPDHARFLDMPFYKTGRVKKDPISEADVAVVQALLEELEPDHIFVAGDLSDPHGTHRMCYFAIQQALEGYNRQGMEGDGSQPTPLAWLYRGAWQEWEVYRASVFVPLSKRDLDQKIEAIFKHESQKDRALFPGAYDEREFWQRARDRNLASAAELDRRGLPAFYAIESFVTTKTLP